MRRQKESVLIEIVITANKCLQKYSHLLLYSDNLVDVEVVFTAAIISNQKTNIVLFFQALRLLNTTPRVNSELIRRDFKQLTRKLAPLLYHALKLRKLPRIAYRDDDFANRRDILDNVMRKISN